MGASVFNYKAFSNISVDSVLEKCEFLDYYALKNAGFKEDEMSAIGQQYLEDNGSPTKACIDSNKNKQQESLNKKVIVVLYIVLPALLIPLMMFGLKGIYAWIKKGFKG